MIRNYIQTFSKQIPLIPKSRVILGISGGQDSNNLRILFAFVQHQWEVHILYCYCNHLWQKDSLQLVLQLANLAYAEKNTLVFPIAIDRLTNEQFARKWRYNSFERICFFTQTTQLAIGHNCSDQIETFLFNLMRGSGTLGLTALAEKSSNSIWLKYRCFSEKRSKLQFLNRRKTQYPIQLIRPLLAFNRYELNSISSFFLFPIWTDQTNFQLKYQRNRIRYQLLPTLRYFFNPNIDASLFRCLTIVNDQNLYFEKLLLQIMVESGMKPNCIFHNRLLFDQLPNFIKQRILIWSLEFLGMPLNYAQIQQILLISLLTESKPIAKYVYSTNLTIIFTPNRLILFTS